MAKQKKSRKKTTKAKKKTVKKTASTAKKRSTSAKKATRKKTSSAKTAAKAKSAKPRKTSKAKTKASKATAKRKTSKAKTAAKKARKSSKKTATATRKPTRARKKSSPRADTSATPPPEPQVNPTSVEQRRKTAKYLSSRDIDMFRRLLLEKRAQLVGDVDTLQGEALKGSRQDSAGDLSSMPIHMADLGTDNYELEFTLGLIEGGRGQLQEVDEALERIREGTYGVCLATGKPIGKARLKAKPWAQYTYEYMLAQETGKLAR